MNNNHPLAQCRWIGADPNCASPLLTRRFTARKPVKARLAITGLGYFIPHINGSMVTEDLFQPVCSEYGPRDLTRFLYPLHDRLNYRIYYCSYDVTELILPGKNTLTIHLGNGWYRQNERLAEGNMSYGDTLKAIYCLTLTYPEGDISIRSDGSETWQPSFVRYNNLFTGELHDYHMPSAQEQPVHILEDEVAPLCPQIGAADRVIRTLTPKCICTTAEKRIYDAGENISGLVRIRACGKPGEAITLRYSENLASDGSLDFTSTGGHIPCASGRMQIQEDQCICGTEAREFKPLFCWHGFRYFEVEGPGETPVVEVIHADVNVTARFDSDSEGLNYLYETFLRTQLNNMHGSIPSDCPHRERLGYTGDGQVCAAATMMLTNSKEFYRKWMQDILDCQDTRTGHTQHTAPLGGGGGGPVGWGGAIVVVPYQYFKQFGDTQLLRQSWESILKWIGYIESRMEGGLITAEEEKGWCLGDWASLDPMELPESFVNTCLFLRCLLMLEEIAPLIGMESHLSRLQTLKTRCGEAVRSAYMDPDTGSFCGSIQGADAFAVCAELASDKTKARLLERYNDRRSFDTGFIGTDLLAEALIRLGGADTLFKLLTAEGLGSFLHMKRMGATTIWEHWDGRESHDHPMFGACVRQLFEGFLGIRQAYGTGGYSQVSIEPAMAEGLGYISGSLLTPSGVLHVTVSREDGSVKQQVQLPTN